MIERTHWPAVETLLRLVFDGKVRRSGARQAELDALQSLGWVEFKNSQVMPEAARLDDLRKRLQSRWPDWEAEVAAVRNAGLDPFSHDSYAPGRRTIEIALGIDPDPISIEVIRQILTQISGDRATLDIRVRDFRGRTAIIDIIDVAAQSTVAFESEVGELKSKLVTALGRLREQDALIERMRTQIRDMAANMVLQGTPYQERHAALIAIGILGFQQLNPLEKGEVVSLLSRMLEHSPGRDAILWREDKEGALLLVVEDPLAAVTAVCRLVRHLTIERFEVRCALSYGLVSFALATIGGRNQAMGRPVEEALLLQQAVARDTTYAVVATGEFRDTLFDGSERFSFVPLPSQNGAPMSGAFGVNEWRN